MDLLGTFRGKIITPGRRKNTTIAIGKAPRRWSQIDIFSKIEKYETVTETIEIKKKRRSHKPGFWITKTKSGKSFWQNSKDGEYHVWFQTETVTKKVIKKRDTPITVIILKEHGLNHILKLEDIYCWEKSQIDKLPSEILIPSIQIVEAGPTPIPKRFRNLSSEEQIKRLEYLKSFGYPENTIHVIIRGYSAKDIKRVRRKYGTKNDKGKIVPISKVEAEKLLQEKIEKRKLTKVTSRKK